MHTLCTRFFPYSFALFLFLFLVRCTFPCVQFFNSIVIEVDTEKDELTYRYGPLPVLPLGFGKSYATAFF